MGNKFFWVYMAVVRLIFRPCVGNHPMGVRFVARNHPTGVRFAARNHPTGVRFVARNHPSVTFGDSSPQRGATPLGEPISNLMFAVAPLEGSSGESR